MASSYRENYCFAQLFRTTITTCAKEELKIKQIGNEQRNIDGDFPRTCDDAVLRPPVKAAAAFDNHGNSISLTL